MNAHDLAARLASLLRNERHAMADFLVALADFDDRKAWMKLGHAREAKAVAAEILPAEVVPRREMVTTSCPYSTGDGLSSRRDGGAGFGAGCHAAGWRRSSSSRTAAVATASAGSAHERPAAHRRSAPATYDGLEALPGEVGGRPRGALVPTSGRRRRGHPGGGAGPHSPVRRVRRALAPFPVVARFARTRHRGTVARRAPDPYASD